MLRFGCDCHPQHRGIPSGWLEPSLTPLSLCGRRKQFPNLALYVQCIPFWMTLGSCELANDYITQDLHNYSRQHPVIVHAWSTLLDKLDRLSRKHSTASWSHPHQFFSGKTFPHCRAAQCYTFDHSCLCHVQTHFNLRNHSLTCQYMWDSYLSSG